jgi:hypothetical protein
MLLARHTRVEHAAAAKVRRPSSASSEQEGDTSPVTTSLPSPYFGGYTYPEFRPVPSVMTCKNTHPAAFTQYYTYMSSTAATE